MLLGSVYLILLFTLIVVSFSPSVFLFRCVLHPLPLPLSSCLGCIPPLIGLPPSLRFYAVASSLFLLSVFLFVFSILSRRCPFLATFLSVLFCLLSMLISDSRFDLVWFRLSCDHGWIRSGSVNVRKPTTTTTLTAEKEERKLFHPSTDLYWLQLVQACGFVSILQIYVDIR